MKKQLKESNKMAVLYGFEREDGKRIEKFFPIGECPDEIVCEDGVKAKRILSSPSISWGRGSLPASVASQRKRDMIKRNEEAGKRMRERWKSVKSQN